ncbi:MAG: hypothetical protein FWF77_04405 [Defluviitaleaceae bacterium]|nr:hypothetical protein [Defluviitaleaceae bacterium]
MTAEKTRYSWSPRNFARSSVDKNATSSFAAPARDRNKLSHNAPGNHDKVIYFDDYFAGINSSNRVYTESMTKSFLETKMEKAVEYLENLKEAYDIPSQIQRIAPVLRVVKDAMSDSGSESQQYLRYTLLLVKTMLLSHSGESLLTHEQIDALIHVSKTCKDRNVDKETFLTHHDYLEGYGLEMIPSEED